MAKANASAYLRGFTKHGVAFTGTVEGSGQSYGSCPFCNSDSKLYVNESNGLWDCKKCGRTGDYFGFLGQVAQENVGRFSGSAANVLAKNRGISVSAMRRFGIGYDQDKYTLAVYGPKNTKGDNPITDVRLYVPGKTSMSSPASKGGLICAPDNKGSRTVWICEGEWDTIAWWSVLRSLEIEDDVFGVTGATNFPKDWVPFFKGKDVRLLLDHDEAGARGTARAWNMLSTTVNKLYWLNWPEGTPEKFDVRDLFLQKAREAQAVYDRVNELLDARSPNGGSEAAVIGGEPNANTIPESSMTGVGMDRDLVEQEYRKWLHMEDPYALDVMFGSLFANRIDSDPFWLFLVAPPSGSKSELLMTLSDAPNIYTITSITPHALISGSFGAGVDPSLIPEIIGKTLVVKDFTTILTMPQAARDEIFGILRDAYDGKIEKKFGNSVHRRYSGHFGIVAGVTGVIEMHTTSSLGERFLKYRLKRIGNIDTGREIILRAMMNIGKERDMRSELRKVAFDVMNRPIGPECLPEVPMEMYEQTVMLAQWVAAMRGQVVRDRYSQQVSYMPEQETGARLGKQLMTFGMGVSVFRNEKVMSDVTLGLMREVARCTAPDKIERIVEKFYLGVGDDYADTKEISAMTRLPAETVRAAMENLEILNILDREPSDKLTRHRWRLSDVVYSMTHKLQMYKRGTRRKTP